MKRIEFIAPVESMRGNLSGNQVLEYPTENNAAFEAPNGLQYARNYQPRFIGAKRAKDGKKYFSVRTKSATRLNAKTREAMALTAGIAIVRSHLKRYQTASYLMLQAILLDHLAFNPSFPDKTFTKWLDGILRNMLSTKSASKTVVPRAGSQGLSTVTIYNPWVDEVHSHEGYNAEQLAKFWMQLANNPIQFTVGGKVGYAKEDEVFSALIEGGDLAFINILGLTTTGGSEDVKYGEMYLLATPDAADAVVEGDEIISGNAYVLSETDPGGH